MVQQTVPNPHQIFKPLEGFTLSPNDFSPLLRIILEFTERACSYQLEHFSKLDDENVEQFISRKDYLKKLYVPKIRFQGENGVIITLSVESPEAISNLPEKIDKIEIETYSHYGKDIKQDPPHLLYLLLDFTTINTKGVFVQPANPTPNVSQYTISGEDENLVRSTAAKLDEFFGNRKRKFSWIHKAGTYDILLMFLGIPLLGWFLNISIPIVDSFFGPITGPFHYMGYVFCGLVGLKIFMGLFNYARTTWPLTEISGANKSRAAQRLIWFTLVLSVIASVIASMIVS